MQNSAKGPVTDPRITHPNEESATRNTKPFLVITGMPRSGTSFLARSLNLCGVYLGDLESLQSNEWHPVPGNYRGTWEHKKITELNRKILALNNYDFHDVPEKIIVTEQLSNEIRDYIQPLIKRPSLAAGIKVPEMILTLESLVEYLPRNFMLVGIFRHPLEVAESLKNRNHYNYERSLNLWKQFNQRLLSSLESHEGFLLDFDWPKERLLSEIKLIAQRLNLDQNIDLSQWYTKELVHSNKTYDSTYPLADDIRSLYTALKKRSEQNGKLPIRQFTRTSEEYMEIIHGLLTEIQMQGHYFRKINDKRSDNPMGALLTMYSIRSDLQTAFPEVKDGNYVNLLEWAVKDGTTVDDQRDLILPYRDWYKSELPKVKPRRKLVKIAITGLRIIRDEGMHGFLRKAFEKIRRREFDILGEPSTSANRHYGYRLRPCSPEQYALWMSLNQPSAQTLKQMREEIDRLAYRPRISLCLAVYNPESRYLSGVLDSIRNQVYEDWELIIVDDGSSRPHVRPQLTAFAEKDTRVKLHLKDRNEGAAKTMNQAVAKAAGDYVVFVDHDDVLEPNALYELVHYLNNDGKDLDFMYTDEALINSKDEVFYIYFRPDFSPDLLMSHCYFIHMVAFKRSFLQDIGSFDETFSVAWDYDLYLRAAAQTKRIGHIPKVLYRYRMHEASFSHVWKDRVMEEAKTAIARAMRMMSVEGIVEDGPIFNYFRVKRRLKNEDLSIIILTKNVRLLERCIKSIEAKTKFENYEIVIVADNLDSYEAKSYLERIAPSPRHRIFYYNKPFNFSAMCNYAASLARGQNLLFLNDDTEVLAEGSIEAMLEHCQREDVGAVGAKLLYPNNTIQHAGVVIGLFDSCEHIHKFHPAEDPGYYGWLIAIRNYSAVTGACIMVPRKIFEKVGGFDEQLSITYNDIDLCLRIRKLGYLVVYTPYAVMYHYEQATRKNLRNVHPHGQHALFMNRCKDLIFKGDPYYNPNLSRWHHDCRPRFDQSGSRQ